LVVVFFAAGFFFAGVVAFLAVVFFFAVAMASSQNQVKGKREFSPYVGKSRDNRYSLFCGFFSNTIQYTVCQMVFLQIFINETALNRKIEYIRDLFENRRETEKHP
jgi:hypothetical protein